MGILLLSDLIFQWINHMFQSLTIFSVLTLGLLSLICVMVFVRYFFCDTLTEENAQYMSEVTGEIEQMATPELKNTLLFTLEEEKRKQNQHDKEINS